MNQQQRPKKKSAVPPANLPPDALREHVLNTYVSLRLGIAIAGILLPVILWIGGKFYADLCLQDSMRAYYHAVGPAGESMRDWFVGILFVVGLFLGLYTGYTPIENWLLNVAGVLCVGVAIFPMRWDACEMLRNCGGSLGLSSCVKTTPATAQWINLHYFCAVTFFLCLGVVCFTCSKHTLSLVSEPKRSRYRRTYNLCGTLMALLPVSAWLLYKTDPEYYIAYVFWAEFFAVVAFSLYWIVKSLEIRETASEKKALKGTLAIEDDQAKEVPAGAV